MSKKNKIIIGLVALATVVFCIIQFGIIPANQNKQAEYAKNQSDSLTHDVASIMKFKSEYIGDTSNVCNLFYALPMSNISTKFEINSEKCTLTVNYSDTIWNIGKEKVHRDLVYNSIASMALIDNLTAVTYNFSGDSFSFNRKQLENAFGSPLSDLLDKDVWKKKVQSQIGSGDFVNQFYEMTDVAN